jgi:hypothetical protein
MKTRRLLQTGLALPAILALPAARVDAEEGRAVFSAGLSLDVDGIMRTLFVEGPCVVAPNSTASR